MLLFCIIVVRRKDFTNEGLSNQAWRNGAKQDEMSAGTYRYRAE